MKQFKFFFPCLLLLASCTQDAALQEKEALEIRLSAGIGSLEASGATRGVINEDYAKQLDVSFARIDQTGATSWPAYTGIATPLAATRAGGAGQQNISFTKKQFYQNGETDNGTKLIGWYPNTDTYTNGTVAFDISKGTVDVMLTPEVTGNKAETEQFGKDGHTFTFNHLLTQVTVKAFASVDGTAAMWGKVTSVKVKGQPTTCTVTLPGQTPTAWGSTAHLLLKNPENDTDMATVDLNGSSDTSPVTLGYAMFKPTTTPSLTLEVITEKGGTRDVTVTLPGNTGTFAAGTAYTVTLNFKSTEVVPTASISAWQTGASIPTVDL
ncbi:fimbrillin family protein [Parabacteroides sp. APC149_11_2_Y6]